MKERNLKILVVGGGYYPIYETAIYNALRALGYDQTKLFTWKKYLESHSLGNLSTLSIKIQNKFQIGPRIHRMNQELVAYCKEFQPDLVFVYSGILVYGKTIEAIKRNTAATVFYYNNDDPFADYYPRYHWRHYRNAVKVCDYNFVYRKKNCKDIQQRYQKSADILRSYYIEEANYPIAETERIEETPEVIFLGHYENDERCEYISALMDLGIQVGVPEEHFESFRQFIPNIVALKNNRVDYNKYLGSCKIPLIFLSKINHDTYTRRCFEIPAAGAIIFCPYNDDMASMFEENKEAVYYRNKQEFIEKVCYYLTHNEEREAIARAGRERLIKDGHEAKDRAKQIISVFHEIRRRSIL